MPSPDVCMLHYITARAQVHCCPSFPRAHRIGSTPNSILCLNARCLQLDKPDCSGQCSVHLQHAAHRFPDWPAGNGTLTLPDSLVKRASHKRCHIIGRVHCIPAQPQSADSREDPAVACSLGALPASRQVEGVFTSQQANRARPTLSPPRLEVQCME